MVGLAVVAQHTPRAVIAEPPVAVILPPEVADVKVMAEVAVVVRVAPPAINVRSLPYDVPSLLVATIRK